MSKYFMWLEHDHNYDTYTHTGPFFIQHKDYFGTGLFISLEQIENIPVEINKGFSQSNIQKARVAQPGTVIKLHMRSNSRNIVLMCVSESEKREIEEAQQRVQHLKERITRLKLDLEDNPIYHEIKQSENDQKLNKARIKVLMKNILPRGNWI